MFTQGGGGWKLAVFLKCWLSLLMVVAGVVRAQAGEFRVAAYNVETYLDVPTQSRPEVKSPAAKAKVRESIRAADADVLALEEMGTTNALLELRASLKAEGLDYPWWEWVSGHDTNIHVAVLSRLPILARRPHTNDQFLLEGQRFRVSRGFAEVDVQVATNFMFTLIAAHLKSKLTVPAADQAEWRLQEARVLRGIIDARLKAEPQARMVVLGDFNDTPDSPAIKTLMGRGKMRLTDTRPAERNGDTEPNPNPRYPPRNVTWTEHYGIADTYTRIDYLLVSPAMKAYWERAGTFIPTIPNWGIGSDHRPVVATFSTAGQN